MQRRISIDLQKAFDSTELKTLINKLKEINIKDKELKLFETYLMGRTQFVKVNGVTSDIENVAIGVPQGSKLAATLFLIFINGIFRLKLRSIPQFYADDGLFKFVANSFNQLIENMNHDINLIDQWFKENHLKLNVTKTKVMILDNHQNTDLEHFIGINFNGELIKREKTIKYLGLIIDEKLSWNQHMSILRNKLVAMCFAVYRIRKLLPRPMLWRIYHAHFVAHLDYLNPIWNKCAEQHLGVIQRLQNKIIKTIENRPKMTPTNLLYVNRLNISKHNYLQTVLAIHKIKLKKMKFNRDLRTVGSVQNSFLRNVFNYRPNFFRKGKCKQSLMSNGVNAYNSLPNDIKIIDNIKLFKKNVQNYIIKANVNT